MAIHPHQAGRVHRARQKLFGDNGDGHELSRNGPRPSQRVVWHGIGHGEPLRPPLLADVISDQRQTHRQSCQCKRRWNTTASNGVSRQGRDSGVRLEGTAGQVCKIKWFCNNNHVGHTTSPLSSVKAKRRWCSVYLVLNSTTHILGFEVFTQLFQ